MHAVHYHAWHVISYISVSLASFYRQLNFDESLIHAALRAHPELSYADDRVPVGKVHSIDIYCAVLKSFAVQRQAFEETLHLLTVSAKDMSMLDSALKHYHRTIVSTDPMSMALLPTPVDLFSGDILTALRSVQSLPQYPRHENTLLHNFFHSIHPELRGWIASRVERMRSARPLCWPVMRSVPVVTSRPANDLRQIHFLGPADVTRLDLAVYAYTLRRAHNSPIFFGFECLSCLCQLYPDAEVVPSFVGHSAAKKILALLELDPVEALCSDVDNIGAVFRCLACPNSVRYYSWRNMVAFQFIRH